MSDETRPLQDPPATPIVRDRKREPAGGYRYAEDREADPAGWREMNPNEQETPAAPERTED
jgi:hypothetical protein